MNRLSVCLKFDPQHADFYEFPARIKIKSWKNEKTESNLSGICVWCVCVRMLLLWWSDHHSDSALPLLLHCLSHRLCCLLLFATAPSLLFLSPILHLAFILSPVALSRRFCLPSGRKSKWKIIFDNSVLQKCQELQQSIVCDQQRKRFGYRTFLVECRVKYSQIRNHQLPSSEDLERASLCFLF